VPSRQFAIPQGQQLGLPQGQECGPSPAKRPRLGKIKHFDRYNPYF